MEEEDVEEEDIYAVTAIQCSTACQDLWTDRALTCVQCPCLLLKTSKSNFVRFAYGNSNASFSVSAVIWIWFRQETREKLLRKQLKTAAIRCTWLWHARNT